ncbi:MAG: DUF5640 domain-containing protein [Lachnospiraceae bacterium]|nr:DUF5640 domain-containing protein [Lachnospiraceae bacterium]
MLNKFFGQKLTKFVSVNFLCVLIASMGFVSCSDDDKDKNPIVGEWISGSGDIYYQFNSNGKGRYICLEDEPGFSSGKIDAIIENPEDPYFFDYSINGNTLKMREYWDSNETDEFTDYTYEVTITGNQMKMKAISYKDYDDQTEHFDSDGDIEIFNRR